MTSDRIRDLGADDAPNDAALFGRFMAGDDQALLQLSDRHSERLFLYSLKVTGNRESARDIVQDVWEQVLRHRSAGKPAPEKTSAWLLSIARHRCLNHIRNRKNHLSLDEIPPWNEPGNEPPERSTRAEALQIGLKQLPFEQREVLILHDYSGYRFDEIAEALNISPSAVRTRAWRARMQLGEIISALLKAEEAAHQQRPDNVRRSDTQ